ncbi:MAG: peroxidase family protein [Planctomycetaceae bacterium]
MMAVASSGVGSLAARVGDIQTLDGSGNNIANPQWGSTDEQLLRRSPVAYVDGISLPSGDDRPSARLVSNLLSESPAGGIVNDRDWTAFVYAWGQFLDHDLGLTGAAVPGERFAIEVPAGDPWFDPTGAGTMTISMRRSAWDPSSGTDANNPRQQVNSLSAFIDGSQVYGADASRADALRELSGGRMKTTSGNLLPFNTNGLPNANDAHRVPDAQLFLAGEGVRSHALHPEGKPVGERLRGELQRQAPRRTARP